MNRRSFLNRLPAIAAACGAPAHSPQTRHLVFIVNGGGVRKKDYYEDTSLSPNVRRLAREGFVFEEDHCERVASHKVAFAELLPGWVLEYIGNGMRSDSIRAIPQVMERFRPRILVCREIAHDVGHDSFDLYLSAVKTTDDAIGRVFDWVRNHPYFSQNTAIVIRPEFGRDDVVNDHGHLHHSFGFYCTHRVASIFWGPDFNRGVDRATVINAMDMAPTLTRVFGVDAIHSQGRVVPGLFH